MKAFTRACVFVLLLIAQLNITAQDNSIHPIDLKPFVGKSQFDRLDASWLVPKGRHVADGVPFQIDGIVELYGSAAVQSDLNIRTNVMGIPVNRAFEEIHLLCATTGGSPTVDVPVATIKLRYKDGTFADVLILFGRHIRQWWGPRHEADSPLRDARCIPAWSMEMSEAAKNEKRSRFYHAVLSNPSPEKEVAALDLLSAKSIAGLMLAGMSVGPKDAPKLANTLPNQAPDPDGFAPTGNLHTLIGVVRNLSGDPLANAGVKIIGAREWKSSDSATRTDHPAVGREVKTDAEGRFAIAELPDTHVYRVLALAEGLEPYIFYGADARRGAIEMRLHAISPISPAKKFYSHAKVIGPDGKPAVGASVEIFAVSTKDGSTCYGCREGFPSSLHATAMGEFLLERDIPYTRVGVNVSGLGSSPAKVWLVPSNAVQTIQLGVGATLIGRVLKEGKPLPGVEVGISGNDRSAEVYAGSYKVRTDGEGRFRFTHIPPDTQWYLYGVVESMKAHGALRPRPAQSKEHGNTNDVGDVSVTEGLTLAGKIANASGEPMPKQRLTVSFQRASHSVSVVTADDGSFKLTGLFPETVSIWTGNNEWNPSPANRSLDLWNPGSLSGKLEQDKTNLLIVLEKRPRNYDHNTWNGYLPPEDQPEARPLSGAEPDGPAWIEFTGKVIDKETGKGIRAKITPGYQPKTSVRAAPKPILQELVSVLRSKETPYNERIYWAVNRQQEFTNGQFLVKTLPLSGFPVLRVEAEGYEPFDSEPMLGSESGLVIKLSKGKGPSGIILTPTGKPASGAFVYYAAEGEQLSLDDKKIDPFGGETWLRKTSADGRYSFSVRAGGHSLFVSHESGWAQVPLSRLSGDGEIQLEAWVTVTGTLVNANGKPVPNEKMCLTYKHSPSVPFANIQERPLTDSKGRFTFSVAPPGELELVRLVPHRTGGWTHQPQTPLYSKPGTTNDLGLVKMDTPPPPTFIDEIKKKLGL